MFLALVGLAVLFIFVRDNTEPVTVEFWGYATPEIELFLLLIITFVLGMIAASFGSTLKIIQLKRQLKNAGGAEGVGPKVDKKKEKSKDRKSAATEPAVNSAPDNTRTDSSEIANSVVAATSVTTGATQEDTTVCQTDALDVPRVDQPLFKVDLTENGSSDSLGRVIELPADEPDTEQSDRK